VDNGITEYIISFYGSENKWESNFQSIYNYAMFQIFKIVSLKIQCPEGILLGKIDD